MTGGTLSVCHLGPTPYLEGVALQEALVRARAEGATGDWLLFADHPPVLTVGRRPSPGSIVADPATLGRRGVEVHEVARGGDVTWHGPGQVVGYPVVALERVGRDLHRWLRVLEEALIRTLARWDLAGARWPGRTGVWIGERKIASIGVAVRRWVGYHGFALNVCPDLSGFSLIHPCGLKGVRMTSMAAELGSLAPAPGAVRQAAAEELAGLLGYTRVAELPAENARRAAGPGRSAGGPPIETHPGHVPIAGGTNTW